jgi:hypothetical protein
MAKPSPARSVFVAMREWRGITYRGIEDLRAADRTIKDPQQLERAIAAIVARVEEERAAWQRDWADKMDDILDTEDELKTVSPPGLYPHRGSFSGAAIRRGQVYGAKEGRGQGQGSPRARRAS